MLHFLVKNLKISFMQLIVNIIGAGKLGKTIGRLLVENNLAKIAGVCNRSLESAMAAVAFIGDGTYFSDIQSLPLADITCITVPDGYIAETSVAICRAGNIKPKSIVMHCSGALTSDVLSAVKIKEALVASVHPMKSFSNPSLSVKNYPGTYCSMEGDPAALSVLEPLFQSIGSITYPIKKDKKLLYHAAGVFASNYLVTLAQQALNHFTEASVPEKIALDIILNLMRGTLSNIENTNSLKAALTGPIQRGDIATIKSHLSAFLDRDQRNLYALLGQCTLPLTAHDLTTITQLETELSLI